MKDFSNLTQTEFDALSGTELNEFIIWAAAQEEGAEMAAETEAVAAPVTVADRDELDTDQYEPEPSEPEPAADLFEAIGVPAEETPVAEEEGVYGKIASTDKIEEALAFGGLDFEVETFPIRPVISGIGTAESPEPEESWVIPTHVGIRRCDDRKTVFAMVQNTYKVFQNRQILEYVSPLLEATGGEFTRVGTLLGGARVFAFITLKDKIALPGGATLNQELIITSSHDGSRALSIRTAATLDNGTIVKQDRAYDLRHTRNVHLRAKEVVSILEIGSTFFSDLAEKVSKLNDVPMSEDQAEIFLGKFLGFPDQEDIAVAASKLAAKDSILKAFREAVAGGNTRLAMALAVAHYESNTKPVRETRRFRNANESRLRSVLSGASGKDVEQVWDELLK